MRKILLAALLILSLSGAAHALEVVTSFGPTIDTNVANRDHFVFDMRAAKTQGWLLPFVGVETLFGELNGIGTFNPVSTKFTVGVRLLLTDHLNLVVEHYSRHSVDEWRPTEKFTAFKLEHRFLTDN